VKVHKVEIMTSGVRGVIDVDDRVVDGVTAYSVNHLLGETPEIKIWVRGGKMVQTFEKAKVNMCEDIDEETVKAALGIVNEYVRTKNVSLAKQDGKLVIV